MLRCSFALITKNILWGTTATWLECCFPFMILHVVLVWKNAKDKSNHWPHCKGWHWGIFLLLLCGVHFLPISSMLTSISYAIYIPLIASRKSLRQGNPCVKEKTWWSFLQIYLLLWVSRKVGCDSLKEWNSSCWFSKEVVFHLYERDV